VRVSYAIKEIFYTLQGEGAHTGTPAVFVRFAGCNLWSGREQDRERDAAKGGCARWCDTDFRGTDGALGGRYSALELARAVVALWPAPSGVKTVVLTGGEPTLQLDAPLVAELSDAGFRVHVETNGTGRVPGGVYWVTVSPKPPSSPLLQHYDEVKAVFCESHSVEQWAHLAPLCYLQPLFGPDSNENVKRCIQYVMKNPHWRLSLQTHKMVGLP
jgi:7-carboxy-7-deazaguanine synthase (Cx14CxxC type)